MFLSNTANAAVAFVTTKFAASAWGDYYKGLNVSEALQGFGTATRSLVGKTLSKGMTALQSAQQNPRKSAVILATAAVATAVILKRGAISEAAHKVCSKMPSLTMPSFFHRKAAAAK